MTERPIRDASACPDAATHTPCPADYLAWHAWAETMAETHTQRRCPTCGLWVVWIPKPSGVTVINPTTLPGWRWAAGMKVRGALTRAEYRLLIDLMGDGWWYAAKCDGSEIVSGRLDNFAPVASDDATGGILAHILGPEAWRVRYSPSKHKRAAGTPWMATLPDRLTLHPCQGEAALAVAEALGRWGGA